MSLEFAASLRGLKFTFVQQCLACAKVEPVADIGALSPAYKCCRGCILKHGLQRLRFLADQTEADLHKPRVKIASQAECGHTRFGEDSIYCSDCQKEYQEKFGKRCPV